MQLADAVSERVGEVAVAEIIAVGLVNGFGVIRRVDVMKSGVVLAGGGVEIDTQPERQTIKPIRVIMNDRIL